MCVAVALSLTATTAVAEQPAVAFTGFEIGASVSAVQADTTIKTSYKRRGAGGGNAFTKGFAANAAMAGLTFGYMWPVRESSWRVGFDAQIHLGTIEVNNSARSARVPDIGPQGFAVSNLKTARVKGGYVLGENLMLYGAVGGAHAEVTRQFSQWGFEPVQEDGSRTGWTAAVGGEYAFSDRASIALEIGKTDLGSVETEQVSAMIKYRF